MTPVLRFCRALWLFFGLLGRKNHTGQRNGPRLAWRIARIVHLD